MKKYAIVKVNKLSKDNEWGGGGASYAELQKAELKSSSYYIAYEYNLNFRLFGPEKSRVVPRTAAPTSEQAEEFLRQIVTNKPYEIIRLIEI